MRFLFMMPPDQGNAPAPPPELFTAVDELMADMTRQGKLVDAGGFGSRLMRVKLSGGKVTVTDGPFAESKELVGGYAILEADSQEEAIEYARRFLQLHADIMGTSYESASEIRRLYSPEELGMPSQ